MKTAADGGGFEDGGERLPEEVALVAELDDMPQRPKLGDFSFEEIMGELERRFGGFVFIGNWRKEHDDYESSAKMYCHGGYTTAIGYTTRLQHALLNDCGH